MGSYYNPNLGSMAMFGGSPFMMPTHPGTTSATNPYSSTDNTTAGSPPPPTQSSTWGNYPNAPTPYGFQRQNSGFTNPYGMSNQTMNPGVYHPGVNLANSSTDAPTPGTVQGNNYNPNTQYQGPYSNNIYNYGYQVNQQQNPPSVASLAAQDPYATAGQSPWLSSATGSGPTGQFNLNPQYFATPNYAGAVAKALGGQVVQTTSMLNGPTTPFYQNQPNQMVQLGNGTMINPATIAAFYSHGESPDYVNQQVQNYLATAGQVDPDANPNFNPNPLWGGQANAQNNAAANWQAGTTPYTQVLSSNPSSIPQGFLSPGQTVSSNPSTYTTPQYSTNQNANSGIPAGYNPSATSSTPTAAPIDWNAVAGLYGSNPLSDLGSLGINTSGGSMSDIATLLNALQSFQSGGASNGLLNPLFWNSQSQAPANDYYPLFY